MPALIQSDGKTATTYQYVPSEVAAYIFVVAFGLATLAHVYFMFRYRAAFCIPLVIGGICETFGYYGRAWSHDIPNDIRPLVLQLLLLLTAPIFLAATVYMTLGRIARALKADSRSMIRPSRLTKIFLLADIVCFCTQMAGSGMQSTTSASLADTGGKVVLASLVMQIVIFCGFVLVAYRFHARLKLEPTVASADNQSLAWPRYMYALYAASLSILARNIFRVFEYTEDPTSGVVANHEVIIYIFDGLLMAAVMWVFLVIHPGCLIKAGKRYTEIKDSGHRAPMALLARESKV
ncbi:rta1 domain-containing protein [Phlyctema vagabunda]|uniref:Rta1 domain-containing protein n=1 Tax=Phlyctema vagabunda TaxID=108571 RepID=A0ABR4PE83_9HELO